MNTIGIASAQVTQLDHKASQPLNQITSHLGYIYGIIISLFSTALIIILFGYEEIFWSRVTKFLYCTTERTAYEDFSLGIFKTIPYWVLYFYIMSKTNTSGIKKFFGTVPIFMIAVAVSNPVNTQRFISLFGLLLIFFALIRKGYFLGAWRNSYCFAAFSLILLPIASIAREGVLVPDLKMLGKTLFSLEFSALSL